MENAGYKLKLLISTDEVEYKVNVDSENPNFSLEKAVFSEIRFWFVEFNCFMPQYLQLIHIMEVEPI